ncbi:hypothetical protein BGZ93_005125 [Podila epicladia]|nr:hypothetical protein BGZ93_005125 [Podila epicladia]
MAVRAVSGDDTLAATQAARVGEAYYVVVDEPQEEGDELCLASRDTIASSDPETDRLLKGLISGQRIREFMCGEMSPTLYPGDLHKIIRNMAALEKFCVHQLPRGPKIQNIRHELAALQQHVNTLVELDITGCDLEQATLIGFLEQCARLQVFAANSISIHAIGTTQSRPWVCAGLRKFRVHFHVYSGSSQYLNMDTIDKLQEMLLERLAGLLYLEEFYMPGYWYRCGLERLKGLTHVQDVYLGNSIEKLQEADARWIVEQWPELKMIHMPAPSFSGPLISSDVARVFEDHGVNLGFEYISTLTAEGGDGQGSG